MQASLEAETKSRNEAARQKKKLESDVSELEVSVDHANRVNSDLQKAVKKLQQVTTEQAALIEDEQRQKVEAREAAAVAERQTNSLQAALEEQKLSVEQAERARRVVEAELREVSSQVGQLNAGLASLAVVKKKLEGDCAVLAGDLEESLAEVQSANERANAASNETLRLGYFNVCFYNFFV